MSVLQPTSDVGAGTLAHSTPRRQEHAPEHAQHTHEARSQLFINLLLFQHFGIRLTFWFITLTCICGLSRRLVICFSAVTVDVII